MKKKRLKPRIVQRNVMKVGVMALSFVMIAGCTAMEVLTPGRTLAPQDQTSAQGPLIKSVKTAVVSKQRIGDPVELSAEVLSSVQVVVNAKTGGDVEEIVRKRGELVQAGDVILRLKSSDANLRKEKATMLVKNLQDSIVRAKKEQEQSRKSQENNKLELYNSILKMEQGLEDQKRNLNKMKNDYDKGLATKAQVNQAQTLLKNNQMDLDLLKQKQKTAVTIDPAPISEVELKEAQLELQQAEQALEYLEVKAPVSGALTEMPLDVGMTVPTGSSIGLIQKLDPIKIKAQLNEDATKYVRGKKELTYYLPGISKKNKGEISYLAPVIDPQTKAYELNLEVPNKDAGLKPGMKLRVQLTEEQEQMVVVIPTQSVVKEGEDNFVFVLARDTVEKRNVQLGRINEPLQEVLSGIKEGEQLIISGQNQLKDKDKVQSAPSEGQK
ncbi:efflux RND transporter periplasmic adaptor subunit [Paenibacillus radicis (ex Xue et al. 2023)]|uniref:Efflux RND transporter periplasmic adaptor subunit n=1 Tax=Paenibacillus radicis (ex Xue et al. 2023) TaxID=2972489 RepID=A0ABT1YQB6_9BACL|nr:efflux RND transporter periplasmic adaptor subunit [Paenibacillus radicis (ex Xue et al. 2023)]MCR8635376.1 efflux RND transporter periplasmic adaptor subunit [Paenibacillus radicis (ex Xue et al. 2023)]